MRFTNRNYYYRKPRRRKKTSKLKLWFYRLIKIGFVAWFLYLFLGGSYGLFKIISLHTKIKRIEKSADRLTVEEISLTKNCEKLKTDLFTIEKIAREKLGMLKDGELIYKIVKR